MRLMISFLCKFDCGLFVFKRYDAAMNIKVLKSVYHNVLKAKQINKPQLSCIFV